MKELTIEEKAKAYDEAIEKAKIFKEHLLEINDKGYVDEMDYIFPELKESVENEDEKIRKALIKLVTNHASMDLFIEYDIHLDEALSWLEKQSEQKPDNIDNKFISMRETKPKDISEFLDRLTTVEQEFLWEQIAKIRKLDKEEQKSTGKVKPRFKFGNWVVIDSEVLYIKEVTEDGYLTDEGGLIPFRCDKEAHLWTIQDVKEGDVLACNEEILLFKSYSVQGRISLYCWYNGLTNNFNSKEVVDALLTTRNKICPATKKQRDTLMKAMADAGYTFDFEKKELKKIEQKLAWSEEDEKMIAALNEYVGHLDLIYEKITIGSDDIYARDFREKVQEWLKSLKPQPKQEWSEEDERERNHCIDFLNHPDMIKATPTITNGCKEWLKSLRPQNTWKPSEEMLEALYRAIPENTMAISEDEMLLDKLYQGLKYGRVLSNK